MNISANEALRVSEGLMSVAVVKKTVAESIGVVPVLCIVGKTRSGKTWATTDWLAGRDDDLTHAAYIDCKGIAFGHDGVLKYSNVERNLSKNHYPKLSLDGIDIVVVDEPHANAAFVRKLIERTAPEAGAAAHRLVVLLLQDIRYIEELILDKKQTRFYSTDGNLIFPTKENRCHVENVLMGKGKSRNQREGHYNGHHKGRAKRWSSTRAFLKMIRENS